jgi:N-acetylglucosaminyldiphosphoundecaprenol N-acetyl-beta-D-mannosaminyltransferase
MSSTTNYMQILGTKITPLCVTELHTCIDNIIRERKKARVLNVNVNCLNLAYERPWLRDFLNSSEVVFCDGAGVIIGARLLGYRNLPRITYADWMWQLAEFAEPRQWTFFFLGARPSVAESAAARLRKSYPSLRIEETHHGYFDKRSDSAENESVVQLINSVKPNLLVVGFGMPLQERWLRDNWDRLDVNIALTGGAVFDYISGELRRPPRWMRDHSLEWLGRLIIEPRRLWRRYIIGNPVFLWRVFRQRSGVL